MSAVNRFSSDRGRAGLRSGRVVAEKPLDLALPAGQTTTIGQDLTLPAARLWDGLEIGELLWP